MDNKPRGTAVRRRVTHVLRPEGEFLGYSTLPAPGTITRGHLLANDVDPETEEPFPVMYRICPAVPVFSYRYDES